MGPVHQFIPTYSSRDAIGTHARHVRAILRELGVESEIYAEGISPGVRRGDAHLFKSFPATTDALLLYQLSTGCKMADWLLARPERKVVNYHNVTPFTVFGAWEPIVGAELRRGREQLADFAGRAEAGIAVSHYNEAELRVVGFERTAVAPVLVDLDAVAVAPDAAALDQLRSAKARGGADWLFVGRVAPHKCQHDLVKAFALYRRVYDPKARLHIVGASASHAYSTALERYIRALGLHRNVQLHGSVTDGELAAHYASADAFVCLSMHEGFCVPLIEAMRNRLPIVAHAAAAVPETLAGAGVLLDLKDPATVAAAAHRVTTDAALRDELTTAGLRRADDFTFEHTRRLFVTVMEDLLTATAGRSGPGIRRHSAGFPDQNEGGGRA